MIARRFHGEYPPRAEYLLTHKGNELGPVLTALRTWGATQTDDD